MPKLWSGQSHGTPIGYRIFIWFIKYAGIKYAYGLLRLIALYYVGFSKGTKQPLIKYYKLRGISSPERWQHRYQSFYNFGVSMIDKMAMYMAPNHTPLTFEFTNEHYLHELAKSGKGGLLLGAHIGNWEIAGHLLQRIDAPVYIVMLDNERSEIQAVMSEISEQKQFKIIALSQDVTFVLKIKEALDNGGLVCMHADRFLDGMRTMQHSFLGEVAQFPFGPFFLGTKLNAPVTFVYAGKVSKYHYKFSCTEPLATKDTEGLLNRYVQLMEEKSAEFSHQWYNFYDFWRQ